MSQPVGKIRQPIDIDEFERRLRAPEEVVDDTVDPLSALSRLVDGSEPQATAPQPRYVQANVDWGTPADQQSPPPRAANAPANPAAANPPANDWEADLRGWEDELRGLASSGPAAPPPQVQSAPPMTAADWDYPAPATPPRAEPELDSFDDYPPQAVAAVGAEHHEEAAAYMARAAAVDYRSGPDPDAPRDLDEYPRSWRDQQDGEHPAEEEEYRDERPAHRFTGRKPLIWVGAVAATLVVLVGGGFALRGGLTGKKDPPTILATGGPSKVQPEAASANNDSAPGKSVFDKGADKVAGSKLVSNEEQPLDVNAQAKLPRVVGVNGDNAAKPAPAGAPPAASTPNAYFPEPKRVKTVSVRPDGSVIEGDSARVASVPTPPLRPSAAPAGSASTTPAPSAVTPKPAAPKTTARVVAPEAASEAAAPKPKPAAPKPVAAVAKPESSSAAPVSGGGYAVQFAATSSDTEARDRVAKVQAQFGSALGGRKPGVVKGEANGASVYRIRVGGLSRDSAVAMCTKVKESGGSCFVAGN